jgi:hypothetical protein
MFDRDARLHGRGQMNQQASGACGWMQTSGQYATHMVRYA